MLSRAIEDRVRCDQLSVCKSFAIGLLITSAVSTVLLTKQIHSSSLPNIMQKSSVVKCSRVTTQGRRRRKVVKSYFMGSSCPKGWIKLR